MHHLFLLWSVGAGVSLCPAFIFHKWYCPFRFTHLSFMKDISLKSRFQCIHLCVYMSHVRGEFATGLSGMTHSCILPPELLVSVHMSLREAFVISWFLWWPVYTAHIAVHTILAVVLEFPLKVNWLLCLLSTSSIYVHVVNKEAVGM